MRWLLLLSTSLVPATPTLAATEQDNEARTRAIAQFRRGMDAVRPCERFIDISQSYFDCTRVATWGTGRGNISIPMTYLLGAEHEKFLHEFRNNDIGALITSGSIRDDLKKLHVNKLSAYCAFFDLDCQEFKGYWMRLPARYPWSKGTWTPWE